MSAVLQDKLPSAVIEKANEDTALLSRIAEGDQDAFSELYIRYQPRLLKFCNRILKNDIALAADIADEALIEVWKSAGSFAGKSQPSTWIHAIARFRLIAYLRKNKEVLQNDETAESRIVDNALLPEEDLLIVERNKQLVDSLRELSSKHREVIEMTYFRELSVKKIAAMLNISESTVKTRMFYARNKLKEVLVNTGLNNE